MNTCVDNVKLQKVSHIRCAALETKPANNHIRTTKENQQENSMSVSAISFPPYDMLFLFVQLTLVTQFSYPLIFSRRLLLSIVANKLLCYWTKPKFRVRHFSNSEFTTGSDNPLRRSDTRINPSARGNTTVHLVCNCITFYLVK